jgi:hypothetical protein
MKSRKERPKSRKLRPWDRRLEEDDEAELIAWVARSGLERVARVAAALTDANGERGQPDKLDSLLLLKIAHLKREQPGRKLHPIAVEVAAEAYPHRDALTSLTAKLERDFRKRRRAWLTLAKTAPVPSQQQILNGLKERKSGAELRALARIVEKLPSEIDMFDMALFEAKRIGREKEKRLRAFGRERAEPLLIEAAEMMRKNSFAKWNGKIPRTLLDLIEPDLKAFARERSE